MIVCKLQGGLGNQLFQWAYSKNLSIIHNVPLYFDLSFLNQNLIGVTKRNFALNKFPNIEIDLISNEIISGKQFLRINEPSEYSRFDFKPSFNYYLDGYFQSEKYFLESTIQIKKELQPDTEKLERIKSIPNIMTNTISIHIRRTDYVTSNGFHPVQSIEYYQKAIETIGEYDYLFVFSDDIDWCKKNLTFERMIFIEGNDEVDDLWIMSMCKNNIIANSSFSWWGAWINNNDGKKVIYPSKWFGAQTNEVLNNIIPENWIKI